MLRDIHYGERTFEAFSGLNRFELASPEDSHVLLVEPTFDRSEFRCCFSLDHVENGPFITGRGIAYYFSYLPGFSINPYLKHIEVGAGLGEPMVKLAEMAADNSDYPKPTVIDKANYRLLRDLLDCAITFENRDPHVTQLIGMLRDFRHRCSVILDSEKVELINCSLEEALTVQPSLRGSADVLVDLYGAVGHVGAARHLEGSAGNFGNILHDRHEESFVYRRRMRATIAKEEELLTPDGKHFFYTHSRY